MVTLIHNLDESVQEYFEFSVGGHTYRFRQLNTEDSYRYNDMKETAKREDLEAFLYSFITPVGKDSPPFPEVAKKMILPQWRNFNKMIEAEFK